MTLSEQSSSQPIGLTIAQSRLDELDTAIVQAVTYSDIFDYPLSATEIHRYLVGVAASESTIQHRLTQGDLVPCHLSHRDGYFMLPGRESIVETRRTRQRDADQLWPRAIRHGRIIASVPFVRMVAITGELAMDNTGEHSDIDYFIVTEPGRLWLSRLMVIAVVRYAALRGVALCPNYLVSAPALVLEDRNLYTAHEVTQMMPISGHATYQRLRALNDWVEHVLPNAGSAPRDIDVKPHARAITRFAESILGGTLGDRLERWEMERKIHKLSQGGQHSPEVSFSPDWCKGHIHGHGVRVLSLYARRWAQVEERTL